MSAVPAQAHEYTVTDHGDYAIVRLLGELTAPKARHVETALHRALACAPTVLVDFRDVAYAHPLALGCLARFWRKAQPDGSVAVFGAAEQPRARFEALGLTRPISLFDTEQEALVGLVLHPDPSDRRRAGLLLERIHRAGLTEFSRRGLLTRVSRLVFPSAQAIQQALDVLEADGHITLLPGRRSGQPGRPHSPRYILTQHHESTDAQLGGPPEVL